MSRRRRSNWSEQAWASLHPVPDHMRQGGLDSKRQKLKDAMEKEFLRLVQDAFEVGTFADAQVRGAQPGNGPP